MVQAVPYMAVTTKSAKTECSVKPVQSSYYGGRNNVHKEDPTKESAFTERIQRAAKELQDQSRESTSFRAQAKTTNNVRGTIVAQTATGDDTLADTSVDFETASNLTQQELEILQMLELVTSIKLTGQSQVNQAEAKPQTGNQVQEGIGLLGAKMAQLQQNPTLEMLIKSLTGQNENLNEIIRQLQKELQHLGLQLNENIDFLNQGNNGLAAIRKELLAALNLPDDGVLNDQNYLLKLAESLARLSKEFASGSGNSGHNVSTASKPGDTGQNALGNRIAGSPHTTGDNYWGIQVKSSDKNQISESGLANRLFGQIEAKQAAAKQTDSKQTDSKQADTKQADTKQADTKQADTKLADTKQVDTKQVDTKQADTRQLDPKQAGIKLADTRQADVRQAETKQAEVKLTEFKSNETAEGKQWNGFEGNLQQKMKGAGTAPVLDSNQGQAESRLYEQNNLLSPNNSEPSPTQSAKSPDPPVNIPRMTQVIFGQITQNAKLLLTPGSTEMQIQLKPDFLGKMNLSITTQNGLVTAKFNTESYRVKEVIEANLNTLKDSLAQQGVKVDQLVVNVSTQKDYSGFQEQNRSYYHHNSSKHNEKAETLFEEDFEKLFSADMESQTLQAYYGNTVDFKA